MKKNVILALVCMMVLASCNVDKLINIGNGLKIEPSGTIVKKEYKQKEFDKLVVDVVANVKFIQSKDGDFRVVLSCPDNYVELFKFEVSNRELAVEFTRDNVNIEAKNVDVTVYSPMLRRLDNSGVSSVEIDKLVSDELAVENSGVGSLYLSGLTIGHLEADCSGVGSIELNGMAERAELDCSGVGSIKGEGLKAKSVKAGVSGVGGINCYASERIDGKVSGVGSLKYGGKPQEKQLERDGVGDISEL